ncbi:hypothetical protein TSUD_335040 [Trifolium subterraneum]|uniref:Peptidase S8/S53 domain-containing protein n=1 Tax=Trifolium subterraneum TaxID=3900 RepID=A0A2Z6NHW4_TRISU|nr:hypothetical protein TSUD_335040 [Trifolium subterraneum]
MQSRCQRKIRKVSSCEEAGCASMILANTKQNLEEDSVDVHVLPAILNLDPIGLLEVTKSVSFSVMQGASMAFPHVSGIGTLTSAARTRCSLTVVKSEIMTNEDVTDHT